MGPQEDQEITGSAYLSLDEQFILQEKLLARQARYWLNEDNFFYNRLLAAQIDSPEKFTLQALKTIPTCNKNDLAGFYKQMQTPQIAIGDYCTTSGTTGNPVTVPLSYADIDRLGWNEAISYRSMELTSNDVIMLCTTIDRTFMAGLAYQEGARKMQIPLVRAGIINPGMHWEYIQQYNVTTLVSVPSYLLKLLAYAKENNIDPASTSVKKILCIGESIRDENNVLSLVGEKILKAWDVKLYGTYASTEMQTAFTECGFGTGMHHIPGLLICELLDEEGNEVQDGEAGELTITHLGVEALPLLRFRTGDICTFDKKPCECGRSSLKIKKITGRKNSMLKYKGTSLYPSTIIEMLNAEVKVVDFIVVAKKEEDETDMVEIHICNEEDPEKWKPLLESKLRVKPRWIKSTVMEIEKIRSVRPSRKPLKFIDLRS